MALTHVLTPLKIGPMTLKNRVVRPAHVTMLGKGTMSEDLIAYHEARARGGVGLIVVEVMGIHRSCLAPLNAYDPSLDEAYPRLIERLKPHGTKVIQQLWHGGHNVLVPALDGSAPWSASDVPGPTNGVVPQPMTQDMIDEIIGCFAQAAKNCERWGAHGVEVHCAHGYLPAQFLSSNANRRTDKYGGSLENRARFIFELLEAVRAAVSERTVVGVRVAPDNIVGGVGSEEYAYVCKVLEQRGLIDYVNISMGNYQSFPKMIGGMHEPMGYELETSLPVARSVKLPTMVVGRFRTLEEADQLIRGGDTDMVGFVRAAIADPDLVIKTVRGEAERVRPCIGCNQACVAGIFDTINPRLGCAVNPSVGYEATDLSEHRLARAESPKQIVVIGGGPAGMEAARAAALRGHKVTLFEAQPILGGTINFAAMAPTRAGIRDFVVWQEAELYALGVDVRTNTYCDISDLEPIKPDLVILATGSIPRMDGVQLSNPGEPIEGINHSKVLSSIDLFSGSQMPPGQCAVVIDDVGHYEGIACAEHLASNGFQVTYVSRHISFAPLLEMALMPEPALERLTAFGARIVLRTRALSVDDAGVRLAPTFSSDERFVERVNADLVVFVSHNQPNVELAEPLRTAGYEVVVVGDANSPRYLQTAVREGYRAGIAA